MERKRIVLITGAGVHAQRYTEVFLFNKDYKYIIYVYPGESINEAKSLSIFGAQFVNESEAIELLETIDLLVIANLPGEKEVNMSRLVFENNYRGPIIVEKPFGLNEKKYRRKRSYLKNSKYIVAYSRQFYVNDIRIL